MQPAGPRRKQLNPAVLANIATRAARERLSKFERAGDVVALWTVNRQFHRAVVRQWQECHLINICWDKIVLAGPHTATRLELDRKLFAALREYEPRGFSDVILSQAVGFLEPKPIVQLYNLNMPGIERLDVSDLRCARMEGWALQQLARIIYKNKESLKVLKMSTSLLSVLPRGLKLEKFVAPIFDDDPNEFQGPWTLDTKVFEGRCGPAPPEFIRTLKADEVHLDVGIWPDERHLRALEPSNSRIKKIVIASNMSHEGDFRFDRIVRDVAAMCPALEDLEVVYVKRFHRYGNNDPDYLNATFDNKVKECSSPSFRILLNAFFEHCAGSKADVRDFAHDHVDDLDLPPLCRAHDRGRPHYHLVKETVIGTKTLRMNFKVSVDDES